MRFGVIATTSLVLAVMTGAALVASLGWTTRPSLAKPARMTAIEHRMVHYYEQRLLDLEREPLAWDCREGSPDRARWYRSSCGLGEHVAEFSLQPGREDVQMLSHGMVPQHDDVAFLVSYAGHALSAKQAGKLRSTLAKLAALEPVLESMSTPPYSSAVEACLDGRAVFVLRDAHDTEFEPLSEELLEVASIQPAKTHNRPCY